MSEPILPNLAARLEAMVDSLKSDPNITVTIAEIGPKVTTRDIQRAHKAAEGYLPLGLQEFYQQVGYFKLEWKYTGPSILPEGYDEMRSHNQALYKDWVPQGYVNILPITEIFGGWEGSLWFPDDTEEEAEEYDPSDPPYLEEGEKRPESEPESDGNSWRVAYRHIKPVDYFVPEACAVFIGPKKGRKGKFSDFVAYHYCGEQLFEMRYTFAEYVERMLVSRGWWYWISSLARGEDRFEVEAFRGNANRLFPDIDLGLFVRRLIGSC
ncbi:hypothetical protein BJY04DRAFT_199763 [Aspergillus karnatakaensis]|uniref:uncharacterized protein n=1 Tax=Aspergillus karnatakaensis TaxID=1810916 RepID=UPI003CCD181C